MQAILTYPKGPPITLELCGSPLFIGNGTEFEGTDALILKGSIPLSLNEAQSLIEQLKKHIKTVEDAISVSPPENFYYKKNDECKKKCVHKRVYRTGWVFDVGHLNAEYRCVNCNTITNDNSITAALDGTTRKNYEMGYEEYELKNNGCCG